MSPASDPVARRRGVRRSLGAFVLVGFLVAAGSADADRRYFTYSYEPKTLPEGVIEFEQWATMRNGREDGLYTRWDIRTEIEAGLTDTLTTALYMNTTSKWDPATGLNSMYFAGMSSEWKYKVSDPTADSIGGLLYGEATLDRREYEAEAKLVLGKNLGNLTLAANGIFENEWKSGVDIAGEPETETEQVYQATGGASYHFGAVSLGAEGRFTSKHEGDESHSSFFAGPVFHASAKRWWATVTLLVQVTDDFEEFERTETRFIVGVHL